MNPFAALIEKPRVRQLDAPVLAVNRIKTEADDEPFGVEQARGIGFKPRVSAAELRRRRQKVLEAIKAYGGLDARKLALRVGISRRVLYRDIQALQEAGEPVKCLNNRHGYWYVPKDGG